jgi:hypothetical protein
MTLAGGEAPQRSTRPSARVCVDHCLARCAWSVPAAGMHCFTSLGPADRGLSASRATTRPPSRCVAHHRLDVRPRERLHRQRAKSVAQVVEDDRVVLRSQPAEAGRLERGVEALTCGVVVERQVVASEKTRSSGPVSWARRLRPSSARATGSLIATLRTHCDLGAPNELPVKLLRTWTRLAEVDVRPTQGAQLAHAQAGERRHHEERTEGNTNVEHESIHRHTDGQNCLNHRMGREGLEPSSDGL